MRLLLVGSIQHLRNGSSNWDSGSLHYYGNNDENAPINAGREVENWFNRRFGYPWTLSILRQGAFYTRSGVQLGVLSRF